MMSKTPSSSISKFERQEDKSIIKKSSLAVRLHILSFLAPKEVMASSRACQSLSVASQALKAGEFYMTGAGVKIATYINRSAIEKMTVRTNVTEMEISESYPRSGVVKLFVSEEHAYNYARYQRTHEGNMFDGDPISQPAVFKVKLLQYPRLAPEFKLENCIIKPYIGSHKEVPFVQTVSYFESNVSNFKLLDSKLIVSFEDDGNFKDLLKRPSRKCVLM